MPGVRLSSYCSHWFGFDRGATDKRQNFRIRTCSPRPTSHGAKSCSREALYDIQYCYSCLNTPRHTLPFSAFSAADLFKFDQASNWQAPYVPNRDLLPTT